MESGLDISSREATGNVPVPRFTPWRDVLDALQIAADWCPECHGDAEYPDCDFCKKLRAILARAKE